MLNYSVAELRLIKIFTYCLGRENPVCFLRDSHFVYLPEIPYYFARISLQSINERIIIRGIWNGPLKILPLAA